MLVPHVQWSGMASTGNVHLAHFLFVCCFVLVLCAYPLHSGLAWPARALYLLARVFNRTVVVPLYSVYRACTSYSDLAWPARVMYALLVFVLVTVRVLLLHSVYCACIPCTVA